MSNIDLISNFWTFVSKRLGAEAPLADWRLMVGKGLDFDKLQRQYLVSTGKSANLITCPKPCSPACGFRKVCEYEGQYEAVCREWPLKSYPIEKGDAQIFTVNTGAMVPELVRLFQIKPRIAAFNDEEDSWQLGEVILPGGKSATVYFTLKIWDHEVTDLVYRINCKEKRPYILLVTARKVIHPTSDAILKDMGAVFVTLNEVTDFNAEAELRLIQECNLPYLIAPPVAHPEPEPDNIFRKCGDAWEVRFNGGEKFMLNGVDTGAWYLQYLLQRPNHGVAVINIVRKISEEEVSRDELPEDFTEMADGFSVNRLPDGSVGKVADALAIRQYREEERELLREIEAAGDSGDNVLLSQLHNDLKIIREAINQAVSPAGQYKLLGDGEAKVINAFRNSVKYAINKIRQHDDMLAMHLQKTIKYGRIPEYCSESEIDWSF